MNKLVHFEVTFQLQFQNFVRLRIVERPSCCKKQLTGHFPDL